MSTSEIKPLAGIKWQSRTAADLATDAGRRTTEKPAMALPRFGRRNPEVDAFGDQIIGRIARTVMEGYSGRGVKTMWDGAPTDFSIREDFPVEALERALHAFATGRGASIMTITCANAETYEDAKRDPEKYDLLRARMGGWTEFFVTMFPAHQAQHERRPVETAEAHE